jgi:ADP-ribose pyrophosphatase YjhB (NUDIX family)
MPIEVFKADIEEGQRLRGWIANAYAQIEFLLGDLIVRCREFPEYDTDAKRNLTHSAAKRVRLVRSMLEKSGPLSPFAEELLSIVDRFEERHETRNLLAHGFFVYLHTPSGDAGFQFKKWHRQDDGDDKQLIRTFRLSDLKSERENFVSLSQEALQLFRRMHQHFGWEGRPDS